MDNLCMSCRRYGLCKKQIEINKYFEDYAIDILDDLDIQLKVMYTIEDCPKYSPMSNSEIEFEEEDDEYRDSDEFL